MVADVSKGTLNVFHLIMSVRVVFSAMCDPARPNNLKFRCKGHPQRKKQSFLFRINLIYIGLIWSLILVRLVPYFGWY